MKELYEQVARGAAQAREKRRFRIQRFADVVRAQVSKLGGGGSEVAFRVAVKDGKVTLTAKADRRGEAGERIRRRRAGRAAPEWIKWLDR